MFKKIIPILLIVIFILFAGFRCKCTPRKVKEAMQAVNLQYWGVWDDSNDLAPLIGAYRSVHPNVSITYRRFRFEEYEQKLIEAWAKGVGPDVYSIHNTWIRKYLRDGFLSPVPPSITMAYPELVGEIKKEVVPRLKTTQSITTKQLQKNYLDVVYKDVVINGKIFGLPLSVDTLVLFYNRDLFNNAGITAPPDYWDKEFQQMVKKLTKQDNKGQIIQSGIAFGGGSNIVRSTDILSVLMMQNGAEMMSGNAIAFHKTPQNFSRPGVVPGVDAFRFYTDFSNPAKEVYSWNPDLNNSLDMFAQGKLAMMLGYSYFVPQLYAKNPRLNYSIVSLPQIEGNTHVNYANYWVQVVSNKSAKKNVAWDFVQFIARENHVKEYLARTQQPTALRTLVEWQSEDSKMGVFASQLLTAKSWYRGYNAQAAEVHMQEMIDKVANGKASLQAAMSYAIGKIQQTMY